MWYPKLLTVVPTSRNDHRVCSAVADAGAKRTSPRQCPSGGIGGWRLGRFFRRGLPLSLSKKIKKRVRGLPNSSPLTNQPAKARNDDIFRNLIAYSAGAEGWSAL